MKMSLLITLNQVYPLFFLIVVEKFNFNVVSWLIYIILFSPMTFSIILSCNTRQRAQVHRTYEVGKMLKCWILSFCNHLETKSGAMRPAKLIKQICLWDIASVCAKFQVYSSKSISDMDNSILWQSSLNWDWCHLGSKTKQTCLWSIRSLCAKYQVRSSNSLWDRDNTIFCQPSWNRKWHHLG